MCQEEKLGIPVHDPLSEIQHICKRALDFVPINEILYVFLFVHDELLQCCWIQYQLEFHYAKWPQTRTLNQWKTFLLRDHQSHQKILLLRRIL